MFAVCAWTQIAVTLMDAKQGAPVNGSSCELLSAYYNGNLPKISQKVRDRRLTLREHGMRHPEKKQTS